MENDNSKIIFDKSDLKKEYKEKSKKVTSINEYLKLRHDYKEMLKMYDDANKMLNEMELDADKLWDQFEFPSLDNFTEPKETKKYNICDMIESSLYGFFVGDALGVPVEFIDREQLKEKPVVTMLEYGTHNQPKGTWSDDSSMTLAAMNGLKPKQPIDYTKIMDNFVEWYKNAKFTPFNEVFDIGNTTKYALDNYIQNKSNGILNVNCGLNDNYSNGNGSLMRMAPIVFFTYNNAYFDNGIRDILNNNLFNCIKKFSSMTHSHEISVMGCYIYTIYMYELLNGNNKFEAYKSLKEKFKDVLNNEYVSKYSRILELDISKLKEKEIKSSGYVVDTLEASLWCVLTTDTYKEAVLKAINLGDDTDTVAAITGSIAGLIYGKENIPDEWINNLQKKEYLEEKIIVFIGTICSNFVKLNFQNDFVVNNDDQKDVEDLLKKGNEKLEGLEFLSNFKVDKKILLDTIEDLKNNPNCCTKDDNPFANSVEDEQLRSFFRYLYENNLFDQNYIKNINIILDKKIEELSQVEVFTYLTFILRGERFSPGSIYYSVEEGTLLLLLERLNNIT